MGPHKFSADLGLLAQRFAGGPACLSDILAATQGRGLNLLMLLLCLPFLTPLPLPGVSTLLGLLVVLAGGTLAFGGRPWFPERMLRRKLPEGFVGRVIMAASKLVRGLEMLARPRFSFLHEHPFYSRLSGAVIMISGLFLVLPIPVPLTNTFPALTVVLLAAAAMERDGAFFLAGCTMFAVTMAYFALLFFGGVHLFDQLYDALLNS